MLEIGIHKGVIVSHRSKMLGDKIAIAITCDVGEERCEAVVFITDKAMGMARRALKVCGFDVDKDDLVTLDLKPTMLSGNQVPLVVDEWNGKQQVKIDINARAEAKTLASLTKKLRDVKKRNDDAEPAPYTGEHGDIPF